MGGMMGRMRFKGFSKAADGSYVKDPHWVLQAECPACKVDCTMTFDRGDNGLILASLVHRTEAEDTECPVIKQWQRCGPKSRLVFDYEKALGDAEAANNAAKEDNRREQLRVSHLDGRPENQPTERKKRGSYDDDIVLTDEELCAAF